MSLRRLATFAVALSIATTLHAQQQAEKKGGGEKRAALTWGPAPDVFPAGAKMAVEKGDPTKSGEFIVRLQFPDGYKIPPHFHPTDEHVRVRSGTFLVGMGDKLDAKATKTLAAGDTGSIPAKAHHFAIAKGPTTVSVRAEGPFAMTYVNPADKPAKK
jgi:quercetin dioxygenase-like cupin family protein